MLPRGADTPSLRAATDGDEPFLFEVFCAWWEREVLNLPDPALVRHFLRIQYTTRLDRLQARDPGLVRYVVTVGEKPVGSVGLQRGPGAVLVSDLVLLPAYRGLGLGTALLHALREECRAAGCSLTVRVDHRADRPEAVCRRLGLEPAAVDADGGLWTWHPPATP